MAQSETRQTQIYDSVASVYDVIWQVPACSILLTLLDTNLRALGPWTGASVLDLACGTGIGLRAARALGATTLVGVDISPEMIGVAKQTTPDAALHVADCSAPLDGLGLAKGSFDLVIGMWLINYAETREQVEGMWANIATYLKPGGRFVGIIQNYKYQPTSVKTLKYGARTSNVEKLPSGTGIKLHVDFDTEPKVEFDCFVTDREYVEAGAEKAGMRGVEYKQPSKEDLTESERGNMQWWAELLEEYPNQLIVARKP